MSCNQPNKLSRTKEQTLKEPPSVNIQKMPPIKLELQHVLLTKQNNSSLLFMHLKKAQHPTLVRRNKMSFLRSFISQAQHPMHVRNSKISLLKLLQRKISWFARSYSKKYLRNINNLLPAII
uniref:Putative ovule protein n=1 Tax=Solanum chacoense TaxID=4108 RepID=A0A0V0IBZ5_SOLCH